MINKLHVMSQVRHYKELAENAKDMGVKALMTIKYKRLEQQLKDEKARQTAINTAELFAQYEEPVAPKRGRKPKAETVQTEETE